MKEKKEAQVQKVIELEAEIRQIKKRAADEVAKAKKEAEEAKSKYKNKYKSKYKSKIHEWNRLSNYIIFE